ncbi:cytochrome aa3 quinol oxidase subunit II [Metabacillus malikii]|uniref:Quinol oxidase subunit 2 n=1 Tax=Metabacillus malikii TaxID=1504265 RepID=A0ABT9ZER5_9BACI|nr:cytochrome aa3 quinol oxidase subunit II [Metabacillus malikii]MDQ0230756.1 cytochrome aa3-600 menaquinol oxidase subunit 2 [Metabacillus malikii]
MFKKVKPLLMLITGLSFIMILTGCSEMAIFDPKGPNARTLRDLIMFSIYFMVGIMVVVYVLFTFVVVKYRDRKGRGDKDYDPDMHGSTKLEIIWTVIPIIIVILLSVPTVNALYELREPPKDTAHKEPIVIHATSADWKWIFSYPGENIETINYVNVPEDHPVLFKITSADSMSSFWVPQIGGQVYGMPGMVNELYLQADEPGIYEGRNSNFTGADMADHKFDFVALEEDEYQAWVEDTQENSEKLTEETYEKLMLPGTVDKMTFSSTHLDIVDHGIDSGVYALKIREKYGYEQDKHGHGDDINVDELEPVKEVEIEDTQEESGHHHHH